MKKSFFSMIILLLLTACSAGQNHENGSLEKIPELLEVSIITPEKIETNQEVTIKAKIIQGEENVTKADEVKFEIWKSGQGDHEMIPAHNENDGTYSIKKTFSEGGNYFIVAHITANRMHSMPKEEVTVLGSESEDDQGSNEEIEKTDQHTDHEHHDHHNSKVSFEFLAPSVIKSNQPAKLTVNVTQEEHIISGARARFEIWEENETTHKFIDTKEASPGTYSADYTFPVKGRFNVKIHVEKGNIHDHIEKTVEVVPQ
ncbi:FixH family protein [Bacillus sp. ISL-45]|uniref:FixH family protein n=1 Tax=Bacillus sp. ISL-45 TaxID=2819128 RepID=UPI001BE58C2E|nr:FixH family protein [Bacillus sp. ISL-45]MBT2663198.1 FixH family protein [Bacillus sp. ISL-45]